MNVHPGFFTSIIQYQIATNGNFEINIENIDNIYYLEHIEKMVDSFLRLLLYKKSEPNTNVAGEHITQLCKRSFSSKEKTDIKEVKEFVVQGDKSVLTDNTMVAETNPVDDSFVFENFSRPEDLQKIDDADLEGIFFGSDDEESGSESGSEKEEEEQEQESEKESSEQPVPKVATPKEEEEGEEEEEEGEKIEDFEIESGEEEGEGEKSEDETDKSEGEDSEEEGEAGDVIENIEFGSDEDKSSDSVESGGGSSSDEEEEEKNPISDIDLPSLSSDTSEQEKTPKPKPIAKKPINVAGLKMTSKVKPLSASALASSSSSQDESREGVTLFQRGTIARDITGAKLANPNPVFQRLYSLDPVLFPKNNEGNMKEY